MRSRSRLVVATLLTALVASLLAVIPSAGISGQAAAADAALFDPGYLVSDEQFYDGDAMSAAQVQAFIDAQHPGCSAGYTSSAFVPTETMPGPVAWFAEHQPVTAIVDTTRALLAQQPVGADIWVALAWLVGILAVTLGLAVVVQRRARR